MFTTGGMRSRLLQLLCFLSASLMNYRYSSSVPVQVQVVVSGFTLPSPSPSLSSNSSRSKKKTFTTKLQMSSRNNSNNNSFDLSKPTFDLFSLRTIRNDALLQYSSLNQSEPLRINLYLILTVTLFSFPTLSEAVIGEEANLYSTLLSTVGGIGSFGLFLKECNSRLNQLKRIEKEMNAEFLELKLSTENKLNPVLFDGGSRSVTTLSSLRGKKRIVALTGTTKELKECMKDFRVFRRRINQANSIVIPVPTDLEGTDLKEWWKALNIKETEIRSCQWIGQPQDISAWKEYFKNLVIDNKTDDKSRDGADGIVWFGLNYNGRSFASGLESPMLLQILGQNLRPADFLDETDEAEVINAANKEVDAEVLNNIKYCQARFYEALTKGDLEEMNSICSHKNAQEVTEVLNSGGRIDNWESCLAEGARPSDMKTGGSDFLVISPSVAYSTCIEFPVLSGGYDNVSAFGATLLAVQRWERKEDGEWKLAYHSTIPWSADNRAGGMLRCDCRGCVALTRGPEKRTFGGLIG